jgi:NADPH oxidase
MKKKNWTKKVYEHFYKRLTNGDDITDLAAVTTDNSNASNIVLPREIKFTGEEKDSIICIEGPFSTCTSYLFDCEHVVLIGGGIGITPFISALESLIEQLKQQQLFCTKCGASNYHLEKLKSRKLKKIDFSWINRDMKNFSWFQKILAEFENEQELYLNAIRSHSNNSEEQQAINLDIHLYCTSLRSNEEAMLNNLPYDLVANMYAAIRQHDIHTELRTRTQVGRPLWKLLFAKFKAEHRSTNVFFTGKADMGSEIKRYCDEIGFSFQHEPYFE